MRIAHVTDVYLPRLGGIEMQVHDLAAHQLAVGHQVTVLTATPAGPAPDDLPTRRLGSAEPAGPLSLADYPALAAALADGDYDVVHCHSSLLSPLAWQAARLASSAGIPSVVTMHSMVPAARVARPVGRALAEWVGERVLWTAVSRVAARRLEPFVPGTVHVLPNGVDAASWRDRGLGSPGADGSDGADAAAGADPRRPLTVVSVMRLSARKRGLPLVDVLDQARAQVPDEIPLRALVVGSGPQEAAMRRALARRRMSWVELPGRLTRPQVREVLADADVFVAPARMESFGIAALEARCAGVPVVAVRGSGAEEFVREGVEGHLVGSDAQMASVVARLLTRPEERRAIARHNATEPSDLAWSRTGPRAEEVYRRAGAAAAAAPPPGSPLALGW